MALHRWSEFRELRHAWSVPIGIFSATCVLSDDGSLVAVTGVVGGRVCGTIIADGSTETKHFIYFYLGHMAILLFKTQ